MSTLAPPELVKTADEWEELADYPSAVCSGIVGDLAHKLRGGYHISIEDQPKTNFSVIKPDDKAPPGTWRRDYASAIDMNMSLKDMKKCHARVVAVWRNRANDPRAKYFNAWNGWDGEGSPGRYSFVTGEVQTASDDHTWHGHLEVKRRYANDPRMRVAWISIISGETIAEYEGADDMTKTEFTAWMTEWARSAAGREAIAVAVLGHDPGVDANGKVKASGISNPGADSKTNPTVGAAWAFNRAIVAAMLGYEIRDTHLPALSSKVGNLSDTLNKFVIEETSRDAQEAARDAALLKIVETLSDAHGSVLTDEQFGELLSTVTSAVVEAGQDAAEQAEKKIGRIQDALDNASEALATADDEAPPTA